MLNMLNQRKLFGRTTRDRPHKYLKHFLDVFFTSKQPSVLEDAVWLRLFPLSLQ
ncbi:hypothetical protein HAX54_013339, partial [Datura stramonium]|nr:hypothetical protein [Datura stramonium]